MHNLLMLLLPHYLLVMQLLLQSFLLCGDLLLQVPPLSVELLQLNLAGLVNSLLELFR